MAAVTTGAGVSGILADKLEVLMGSLKTETGDTRWRLHLQLTSDAAQYSLRVYAPDRFSQEHPVVNNANAVRDIRDILLNEARSWEVKIRPVLTVTDDTTAQ